MSLARWSKGCEVYVWQSVEGYSTTGDLHVWVNSPDGVVMTAHQTTAEVAARLRQLERVGVKVPAWVFDRVDDVEGSW